MGFILPVLLLSLVVLLYVLFVKWKQQYWRRRGVPQLTPNLLFGDLKPILLGRLSMKDHFLNLYNVAKAAGYKHVGLYAAFDPQYMPIDLNLVKRILTKDFAYFSSHGIFYHKAAPLTNHLFSLEGSEWKNRRTKLTPVFTTGKMKMMFETLIQTSTRFSEVVDNIVEAKQPVNIKDVCARFTTDIISSVAFGLEADSLNNPQSIFRRIGQIVFEPRPLNFAFQNFLPPSITAFFHLHLPREVPSYFEKIVKDTISYREKTGFERNDFMQLMLQLKNKGTLNSEEGAIEQKNKHYVNEDEIINESFLFFLAGYETSSSTMNFAFCELAQNMDIQERLRQEIISVLAKNNGQLTYDALMEMEYLDLVLKETLRKYPVVPDLPRKCTQNYTVPGTNVVIEKGTRVHISVIGIHLDPEYYSNPEQFNPDNFLPENVAKRPEFSWLPFGEGPRQCIGLRFGLMQAKIGLVTLLRKFRFTLHESTQPPFEADAGAHVYSFKRNVLLVGTKVAETT